MALREFLPRHRLTFPHCKAGSFMNSMFVYRQKRKQFAGRSDGYATKRETHFHFRRCPGHRPRQRAGLRQRGRPRRRHRHQ
ncbi:protein of unknown function [Aminobacter niigataensis]|nr:protein of unknown function [Aminobacter niigataensis]